MPDTNDRPAYSQPAPATNFPQHRFIDFLGGPSGALSKWRGSFVDYYTLPNCGEGAVLPPGIISQLSYVLLRVISRQHAWKVGGLTGKLAAVAH